MKKRVMTKEKTSAELYEELATLRKKLRDSVFSQAGAKDFNPAERRATRRNIARVLTALAEGNGQSLEKS